MPIAESDVTLLQVPQLAALATSACPAWLWSTDASHLLWANASGAANFGAVHAADLGKLRFATDDPAPVQIARLAATLPSGGQERLERLRGFGGGLGRLLTCGCSRIVTPDGTAAVLVVATGSAGPPIPLRERVHRLVADGPEALAAFAPDGALLHANAAAESYLGGATTLSALGLETLAARSHTGGQATVPVRLGQTDFAVTSTLLGRNHAPVVLLSLAPAQSIGTAADKNMAADAKTSLGPETPIAAPATATPSTAEPVPAVASVSQEEPTSEHRHPLRFVWHMDAIGRFIIGSDEFVQLIGPLAIATCGRPWSEIAIDLKLDPDDQVAHAIATRETWSGIPVSWPVDETGERLPVELSGLPVFDRARVFRGYRGFGVCRDIGRLNQLARTRQTRPIGFSPEPGSNGADAVAVPQPAEVSLQPVATPPSTEADQPPEGTRDVMPDVTAEPSVGSPAADNVVPFRASGSSETRAPSLSPVERNAFRELAQELTARLRGPQDEPAVAGEEHRAVTQALPAPGAAAASVAQVAADIPSIGPAVLAEAQSPAPGQLQPRGELKLLDRIPAGVLIFRNDVLLYANRHLLELTGYGDIDGLAAAGGLTALFADPPAGALADNGAARKLLVKTRTGNTLPVEGRLFSVPWCGASALALILTRAAGEERPQAAEAALEAAQKEIRELKSNLDRVSRREAQKAATAKADFLAKVSHEIRTPLNSMIGFAEVILAERFGSIGNERYREYLRDIHAAGTHLVSILNDLLDLSKIETGQLDLAFTDVDLNDLTQQCVAVMQPQANRSRIIIRTALAPGVPQVAADERSLRQIVINLLGHAINFTGPGGQVIVSSATTDAGETLLRVRDTGAGMRETDVQAALDPFHPTTPTNWGAGGTGLRLPLTKALAEANRAHFTIKSSPNAGTLVEIAFPRSPVAAH
ncbi:MAG: histidine kinase dimerization/phospho-acceptor domain-containing protein [Xanthobacteraceae bacterium]